jgi:hypothetical protein
MNELIPQQLFRFTWQTSKLLRDLELILCFDFYQLHRDLK